MNQPTCGRWLGSAGILALAIVAAGCSNSSGSAETPAPPPGIAAPAKVQSPIGATGRSFAKVEFPRFANQVDSARDVRNRPAPPFAVSQWITSEPEGGDKVVIIDFWATWCGPCRMSIPHMNELAKRFADDVVAVGISDESPADFQRGMQRARLDVSKFSYSLALDPNGRMKNALAVQGIPHAIVISSDWVVRWQGHPMELDEAALQKIVDANKRMTAAAGQS